jgi:hypothetical protein
MSEDIMRFLDEEGRIKSWPSKKALKLEVLRYLSGKFEYGLTYKEKEVNNIINNWHTFNDFFLLRRGMIESCFMKRTRDGAEYWREESLLE